MFGGGEIGFVWCRHFVILAGGISRYVDYGELVLPSNKVEASAFRYWWIYQVRPQDKGRLILDSIQQCMMEYGMRSAIGGHWFGLVWPITPCCKIRPSQKYYIKMYLFHLFASLVFIVSYSSNK